MTPLEAKRRIAELGDAGWAPLVKPAGAALGSMAAAVGAGALLGRLLSRPAAERPRTSLSAIIARVGVAAAPLILEQLARRTSNAAVRPDQQTLSRSE